MNLKVTRSSTIPNTFLVAFTAALSLTATFSAQVNTGRINGSLLDASGATVSDGTVRAVNANTGVETQVVSAASGEYLINFLVPGTYRVEAPRKQASKRKYGPVCSSRQATF